MYTAGFLVALALSVVELPVDAPIPNDAVALSEPGRYRSQRSFEETLDFFRRIFNQTGGVRWRNIVSLPGIKAKHIESLRKKTRWEGINVYEKQGEVRFYIIPRDGVGKDAAGEKKRTEARTAR